MQNTKWVLKEKKAQITSLPIDKDILNILATRGITKKEDIINFIQPNIKNLHDPLLLTDLEKAVERIFVAISNDEKICIYGDYDVDGITSTSILYLALKKLGAKNIDFYIPIRDEGYGLNNQAIKQIKDNGADLIITVDCGITSYKEINYANSLGLTVIVTDHHNLLDPVVPNAYAVVNPKRLENKYPFKELAGVGTAFMLVLELFKRKDMYEEALDYIDLVSLGTIADVVPLVQENRIIVKYGLKQLQNTKNLGLKLLINKVFQDKIDDFSVGDVAFTICPIFNAAGRLQDAKLVVHLLISQNAREIEAIIEELLLKNSERKKIQNDIFNLAKKEIEKNEKDYILISSSPLYHHGVIGIVAAKFVDIYFKPCIILEEKKDEGIAVASCRSIPNFDITKALQYCGDLLVRYGGHVGAAGFTIEIKNIKKFKEKINAYAKKYLKEADFCKLIEIDKAIPIQKISYEFYRILELLKPFGFGNPNPTFLTKNIIVENSKVIGQDKTHLSFDFSQKGFVNKGAVWFSKASLIDKINKGIFYDIVYKINLNLYNGKYYTKVLIDDMKESKLSDDGLSFLKSLHETSFPMKSIFYSNCILNKDEILDISYHTQRLSIYKGNNFLGKLDYNISRLLYQLNKLYNFNFKIKVIKTTNINDIFSVDILILRKFDLLCFKKNDINIFKYIKKELISYLDYDSTTKLALSALYKKHKNILLSSKNINTPLSANIYLTFAMYNNLKGFSTCLLTKNNNLLTNQRLAYFTTKEPTAPYAILDRNTYDKEIDLSAFKQVILLDDKIDEFKDFYSVKNKVNLPKNILKLSKENVKIYGNENIYTSFLSFEDKKNFIEKIKNNEIILSDESIYEIL
ncbi:single-stranded-DNA-specific exonuclease RecJ [Sneathia sanguinegens]|uniref:single-stranded-DNA-specific exonuclease RecJ n=1 Tax=Sneathia sanguinegens TaxID=40543 RepID=UPI00258436F1|nr:single-stranded-DNA-specific exonuclease RecJ [Sneathia sanguinegens]MDU4652086.1 single-stranded-DNA-specific exonuclease RecJ [Sneathia sanguinegens]